MSQGINQDELLSPRQKLALQAIESALGEELWDLYCNDTTVSEIMANSDGTVFIEAAGKDMFLLKENFSPDARRTIIGLVADLNNLTVSREDPNISGRIPGRGVRFEGMLPPAVRAPSFTMRMPSAYSLSLEQYVEQGVLTPRQYELVVDAALRRKNILIVGGTGSGKTTFANAVLSKMKDTNHRIITIEDTPELRCEARNTEAFFVSRQSRFDYRSALFACMRYRPDRIVVGELRDGEAALELLKAWNTGHNGGLATIHANNARMALPRLEQLLDETGGNTPKDLIAQAIDLVVYIKKVKSDDATQASRIVWDVATLFDELSQDQHYQFNHRFHDRVSEASRF